jgi:tartrate dehydrogenase/decarboxylase/D-malate dehydrogenase
MSDLSSFKIAVIPGDGIGQEVMPEGLKIIELAANSVGITLELMQLDWACADYYLAHGVMLPEDWKKQLDGVDAIYFGAVGWPEVVPDHISLWDSLLQFRREFDQYINLRPVRTFTGVPCPLAGKAPGDIQYSIVRENTEGEYSSVGGVMFANTDREVVVQQSVFTRHGADRVLKYAYELAASSAPDSRRLTVATKSNGMAISMPWWDERAKAMSNNYPDVVWDKQHIDILCARLVLQPERFDVIVATNLFGDILSDLGPATTGTIGIAPSANLNPERVFPSLFEPVHGSAPDIAGKGIANPVGMIWSGAMMLDFLTQGDSRGRQAHDVILKAIEMVLANGPRTPDLGGDASTKDMGDAIAALVSASF